MDMFCGLGGWTKGLLAAGWNVVGFDIERHAYGDKRYPAQLVLQDVLTLHGSQFKNASLIVASPPCQNYSYLAMPWSRSKAPNSSIKAKALRKKWETEGPDNRLFDACFRIQREANLANRCLLDGRCLDCIGTGKYYEPGMGHHTDCRTCDGTGRGRYIPLIVENVRGCQPWTSPAKANYGSFYLWGDIAMVGNRIICSGQQLRVPGYTRGVKKTNEDLPYHGRVKAGSLRMGIGGQKTQGGSWFRERNGEPQPGIRHEDRGTKQAAGNGDWVSKEARDGGSSAALGSKSNARKAASAMIAEIPLPLSEFVGRAFYPKTEKVSNVA